MFNRLKLFAKIFATASLCIGFAHAEDNRSRIEAAFFGASPGPITEAMIYGISDQMSYDVILSKNNPNRLVEGAPDQPLWISVSVNNAERLLPELIETLKQAQRTARTTIVLKADAANLGWLNKLDIDDKTSLIITTPRSDLDYLGALMKPIEEKLGSKLPLRYRHADLAAATLGQLLQTEEQVSPVASIKNWRSGFTRAGFETGMVKVSDEVSWNDQVRASQIFSQQHGKPIRVDEAYPKSELFSDDNALSKKLANLALSTNCCSTNQCGWDQEFPELFKVHNLGPIEPIKMPGLKRQ